MSFLCRTLLALMLGFLACTNVYAMELHNEFHFSAGYRNDHLSRKNVLKESPPFVDSIEEISIKGINLGQVGMTGTFILPRPRLRCEINFLDNVYFQGYAYCGAAGNSTKMIETIELPENTVIFKEKTKVKSACTQDYQLGLGYLFEYESFGLGVIGGYAYSNQKISLKQSQVVFTTQSIVQAFKTNTAWYGPWLGVELMYQNCGWRLGLGYEYHFATYSVNHQLTSNFPVSGDAFENKLHSNHAWGDVIYVNGYYTFCTGWQVGLCFKYQDWGVHRARLKLLEDSASEAEIVAEAQWRSYTGFLDIGYQF